MSAHGSCAWHDERSRVLRLDYTYRVEGESGKREHLIYGLADVAAPRGISSAGLRLAVVYERVHGELERDPRLDRLLRAREMVRAGQAASVESALTSLASGDPSVDNPRLPAIARARREHSDQASSRPYASTGARP
jgi:hypothetical protein